MHTLTTVPSFAFLSYNKTVLSSDSVSFVENRPLVGKDIQSVSQVSAPSISELGFPGNPLWTSERPPVGQFKVSEDAAPVACFGFFLTWISPYPQVFLLISS